ncbi:YtxH domain-containing protein [Dehalococcoidia bacterium]|nr:YtxH domain-containing protein [Dehalococcoidia bacterium]
MGNDKRCSGFFSGFILGGIVGAIAAFVLSQKGGRDTLKAKMKDIITQARENIREAIEEGREAAVRKEAELQDDQEK